MSKFILPVAGVVVVLAAAALAADWPQFRGPNHDGISTEKGLVWPEGEPKVLWRVPMGAGYSGIVVAGDKAFCFALSRDQEVARALDASTGKELWAVPLGRSYVDDNNIAGPRSTPAVDGQRVYFFGTYDKLFCLDAADGKVIWSHDIDKEFEARAADRGNAASPLIDGKLLFICCGSPGQSFLAFDKISGELVWKGQDDKPSHTSPVPATIGGVRQVLFLTKSGVAGVEEQTGNLLWRYKFPYNLDVAASPVVADDIVYCTASYQIGSGAARITKTDNGFAAKEIWRTKNKFESQFVTPVYLDGYVYGIYKDPAMLRCIDIATGKEMWSQKGISWGGSIALVDGRLLVQDEKGVMIIVEASPNGYKELGRWDVMKARSWTMPAVSGGRIYTRSIKEAVCLDLSGK